MTTHMLMIRRGLFVLASAGVLTVNGCNHSSGSTSTMCTNSVRRELHDSARTPADSARIMARQVPAGGTSGC